VSANADGDTFRFVFNGVHSSANMSASRYVPGAVLPTVEQQIGCLTVTRAASGVLADYNTGTYLLRWPTTLDAYAPSRLIAIGLEIANTTAPLYQQGTMTVIPVVGSRMDVLRTPLLPVAGAECSYVTHSMPMVPGSLDLATVTPQCVSWPAKRGAYIIGKMASVPRSARFRYTDSAGNAQYVTPPLEVRENSTSNRTTVWAIANATNGATTFEGNSSTASGVDSGFQPFAAFVSGVSAQTTLRVTLKTYVEYFPELDSPGLLATATNSPQYDHEAFQAYHAAAISLPIAVPVDMNPKGEWWEMVVTALRKAAAIARTAVPIVLNAAGMPVAASAATVLGNAALPLLRGSRPPNGNRKATNAPKKKKLNVTRRKK
jgi:hypothetical protein